MTSSNGNIFRVTGHLCGEFTGYRWILRTKASDVELWCFFIDLRPNKRLSIQSWGWWFETQRTHYDVTVMWRRDVGLACSELLALCEGKPRITVGFSSQSVSDVFYGIIPTDLLNIQLSYRWYGTSWRHSTFESKYSLPMLALQIYQYI